MKTMSLTYSHKELQFMLLAAAVEGLQSADLTGRGFFITFQSHTDSAFAIELWKSATKSELGDGRLLHRHEINKGEYRMNDVRLGVIVSFLKEQCEKFVNDITPILQAYHGGEVIESPFSHGGWHGSGDISQLEKMNEGESYSVLIDLNGNRELYSVGYYDYTDQEWDIDPRVRSNLDLINMKWTHLPFQHRDRV